MEKDLTEYLTNMETNVGKAERVASAAAGGALIAYGLKQGGLGGTLLSALGGVMLFRGATGHSYVYDAFGLDTRTSQGRGEQKSPYSRVKFLSGKIHVTKVLTINRSASELYGFWRNFENLPKFMRHLEAVTTIDEKRSHWKAKAPLGQTVEWDAEITSDIPNQRIGWKSLEGAFIPNSGVIEFLPTRERGSTVKAEVTYEVPGGRLGEWIAWAFGEDPKTQISADLRRFKMLMETGTVITTEGQPSGREPLPKTMTARA